MIAKMICGGLGGVMGAWLALIKYVSQDQDFDKQHILWYVPAHSWAQGLARSYTGLCVPG
jgi:hypothetical protein